MTSAVRGVDASAVEVDAHRGFGPPVVDVVGLPDITVKESRERVRTAVENSGFKHPFGGSWSAPDKALRHG